MRNKLRQVRQEKEILQYQLADKVGCSPSLISLIENRELRVRKSLQERIAKKLGVERTEIFPGHEE